jgi:hypothetical protein
MARRTGHRRAPPKGTRRTRPDGGEGKKQPERPRRSRRRSRAAPITSLSRLRSIDGRHPLARVAPSAVVEYPARRRHDGRIAYFNFDLAREIGLIPTDHPDRLVPDLHAALLETFGLVIVNEWDVAHDREPPERDRLPHRYMATRYLQIQHPDKRGRNSGDGRSVWNGRLRGPRGEWDVSSCGTGVTRLCPATSATGRFFRTGNALADYGCGTAHVEEGLGAALMSEAFARNGVRTERVLAVVALPSGLAINVRVAPNLLRPSHFFGLLRRREDADLRSLVAYYADREIRAGRWPALGGERARIRHLPRQVAMDFARATATFESEYVFCWLEWDGDNILTDGSILDYGSVRQFGLYHHRYRFQDTDRLSTSIPEQRRKARQIVQRFAQIRELLLTGVLPPLDSLGDDATLRLFDETFALWRRRLFLRQIGFDEQTSRRLSARRIEAVDRLLEIHRRLERRRSSRGPHRVPDGLSWNAVYCMRDVLRCLPGLLLESAEARDPRIEPERFYSIALSDYASRLDRTLTPYRRRLARDYQTRYLALVDLAGRRRRHTRRRVLEALQPVARARNPRSRMTGDGLTHATHRIANSRHRLAAEETHWLVQAFADSQQREPVRSPRDPTRMRPLVQRIHRDVLALIRDHRESL